MNCWKYRRRRGSSGVLPLIVAVWGTAIAGLAQPSLGQITSDGTLPIPTVVGAGNVITGGTAMGSNLFHSFSQFSLSSGTVSFNGSGFQHIIARVTGGSPALINGTIAAPTNLILINPAGITFGASATLSVTGSFLATTANSVVFPDGIEFSATSPTPTLSMSVPSGLQFNGSTQGTISLTGSSLRVGSNATLALVGSTVSIGTDALLVARTGPASMGTGGQVALGGVNTGQVSLTPSSQGWALGYGGVSNFGNVSLAQGATINVNGTAGGTVQLAGNVSLLGATVASNTTGALNGNEISVLGPSLSLQNGSTMQAVTTGTGSAGNIRINTGQLSVLGGSQISVSTRGSGNGVGGDLLVNASNTLISGTSASGIASAILSQQTSSTGLGAAGSLTINSGRLVVQNGGQISVSNGSSATTAGNIHINAPFFQVLNGGGVQANTAGGQGNIFIQSRNMQLIGSGSIQTNASGSFNGGNISINTATLVLLANSSITANAQKGFGGNVAITATGIFAAPGSKITATSELGAQFDGTVELKTPDVDPSKGLVNLPTDVTDLSKMVEKGCGNRQSASSFVVTGRGGLPPNPGDVLSELPVLNDLGANSHSSQSASTPRLSAAPPPAVIAPALVDPLVEAQGWVINATGDVVLLAETRNGIAQSPGFATATCHARK